MSPSSFFLLCLLQSQPFGGPFQVDIRDAETQSWIAFLLGERRDQTREALERCHAFVRPFRRVFEDLGVPPDLVWLALIESGFRYDARSTTGALGMFQFKRDTALLMGLRIGLAEDERLDPMASARACASYLRYLRAKFPSWELVLAAYNLGEGDLLRAMDRHRAHTWAQIQAHLREETRNYVGKIKAAALVGNAYLDTGRFPPQGLRSAGSLYTVQPGDTLFSISRRFGIQVHHLKRRNQLKEDLIRPGQSLIIPEILTSTQGQSHE